MTQACGPSGIEPKLLVDQVYNTAPFLKSSPSAPKWPQWVEPLLNEQEPPTLSTLNHPEYFRLCLIAHHLTVATFVPTDVDVHIRFKLWQTADLAGRLAMAQIVLESLKWDTRFISKRYLMSTDGLTLSGHEGEWFSTAVAAFCSLRAFRREPAAKSLCDELQEAILQKISSHEAFLIEALSEFKSHYGLSLKASQKLLNSVPLIAHNLGDLDRVWDAWNTTPETELFCSRVYKLGHAEDSVPIAELTPLQLAGRLNKALTAHENHRHFALRRPRALRSSEDWLIGIGPFFDTWGEKLSSAFQAGSFSESEFSEIIEALISGYAKLNSKPPAPMGYARALSGILQALPGGERTLTKLLPAKLSRELKTDPLRSALQMSRLRFEERYCAALKKMTSCQVGNSPLSSSNYEKTLSVSGP